MSKTLSNIWLDSPTLAQLAVLIATLNAGQPQVRFALNETPEGAMLVLTKGAHTASIRQDWLDDTPFDFLTAAVELAVNFSWVTVADVLSFFLQETYAHLHHGLEGGPRGLEAIETLGDVANWVEGEPYVSALPFDNCE